MAVGCLLLFGVVACEKQTDKQIQHTASLSNQIVELKQQLDLLEADFTRQKLTLEVDIAQINSKLSGAELVDVDMTQKSYTPIHTSAGVLFVLCNSAEPHLSGHKLKLAIGNPLFATFNGFKLKCVYGLKQPKMPTGRYDPKAWKEYVEVSKKSLKSMRETEARFTETIGPGLWTEVELLLVPSSADELGMVRIEMEIDVAKLRN